MASSDADLKRLRLALDKVLIPVQYLFIHRDRLTEYKLIARGGFGSVSTAQLRAHPESTDFQIVAVKELLPLGDDAQRIKLNMSFARELRVWTRVDHPNVLSLTGFFLDASATVALFVSPFEPHGNLQRYLERALASDVALSDTRRLELAVDTASGLLYLHTREPPICHGDIKSLNILISAEGRAKLCDFGLAKIIEDHPSGFTTAGFEAANTAFYMSYELACVPGALRTLMSDVWAWGGVSLEIFTGKSPYGHCKSDKQVYFQMFSGIAPASLESLSVSDRIRDLLQRCWERAPENRITMVETCDILAEEKLSLTGGAQDLPSSTPDNSNIVENANNNVQQAYKSTVQRDYVLLETLERLRKYRLTTSMIELTHSNPIPGGSGTIYQGNLRNPFRWGTVGALVAVEIFLMRGEQIDWSKELSMYAKQMELWAMLNHPNILPFLGFEENEENAEMRWVSPWMANGNLTDYIDRTTPSQTERIKLSFDVSRGILYLHTLNPAIIHGDLKAWNILLDSAGRAIISEFLVAESALDSFPQQTFRATMRWSAPELLLEYRRSLETDIWAWGCLLIEIFLGRLPFATAVNDSVIIYQMTIQQNPPVALRELSSLPAKLRQHMEACWKIKPTERPTIQEGVEVLDGLIDTLTVSSTLLRPAANGAPRGVYTGVEGPSEPEVGHPQSRPAPPQIHHLGVSHKGPATSTTGASASQNTSDFAQRGDKDRLARVKRFFGSPRSESD